MGNARHVGGSDTGERDLAVPQKRATLACIRGTW